MTKRKMWRIANGLVVLAALAFSIFSFCNNQLKDSIVFAVLALTCFINYILSIRIEKTKNNYGKLL